MILKSMTAFVKEQFNRWDKQEITSEQYVVLTDYFRMFLEKISMIWMFVPCDKKGNIYVDYKTYQPKKGTICIPYEGLFEVSRKGKDVELLNEPQFWKDDQRYYNKRKYEEALKEYQEAKERVLFEGFTYHIGLDKNNPDFWYIKNSSCKIHDYEFEVAKISVETIANRNYQIILAPTAQKLIGL